MRAPCKPELIHLSSYRNIWPPYKWCIIITGLAPVFIIFNPQPGPNLFSGSYINIASKASANLYPPSTALYYNEHSLICYHRLNHVCFDCPVHFALSYSTDNAHKLYYVVTFILASISAKINATPTYKKQATTVMRVRSLSHTIAHHTRLAYMHVHLVTCLLKSTSYMSFQSTIACISVCVRCVCACEQERGFN